ncbi:sulfotransferase, partial [Escherichia coli]|uniref:sulfotransferase n=1 Tax=Escherichia coli TaxID=562 RepID=UPI001412154E
TKKQATKKVTKAERTEIKLAFNSSMPRSGSELLQGLLSQHPDICAGTTSPLLEYVYGAYKNFKDTQEAISQQNSEE